MNLLKLIITFTTLGFSVSFAATAASTTNSDNTSVASKSAGAAVGSHKRVVKSGLTSKSKFKSDVKAINAKSDSTSATKAKKTTSTPSADNRQQGKLSTNVDFNDQLVGGKYQSPMEALSVVEDEKFIDDLIGVRKNFQDREQRAKAMR